MHMRKRVGDSVSDMERSLPNIFAGRASESKEVKDIIPEKMLMPLEDGVQASPAEIVFLLAAVGLPAHVKTLQKSSCAWDSLKSLTWN
ncbi:Nfx1-Type Zinc Finger-Containing Protein 1 [Manis pentadactyla]|nr:Nfx1-Type Zinc Finger-Containing Protein 1 [Manis pentadactyla]